ncbi:hypothetical protein BASA50_010467 [Batrachochytrium salamandrivorans]|uniref:TAFII55 protein conserved region domain-containing protein n=1 Tax=Batrachochytrium salamandrivorans TaxID=1357716 RepID=A0ABQ8F1C5_9FUNG|nr:hypothetical protein BASA50_010467 [Batrachochytrium salamandrivorans]
MVSFVFKVRAAAEANAATGTTGTTTGTGATTGTGLATTADISSNSNAQEGSRSGQQGAAITTTNTGAASKTASAHGSTRAKVTIKGHASGSHTTGTGTGTPGTPGTHVGSSESQQAAAAIPRTITFKTPTGPSPLGASLSTTTTTTTNNTTTTTPTTGTPSSAKAARVGRSIRGGRGSRGGRLRGRTTATATATTTASTATTTTTTTASASVGKQAGAATTTTNAASALPHKPTAASKEDEALSEAPIEDHLILRVPASLAPRLRLHVQKRDLPPTALSLRFSDARKGEATFIGIASTATAGSNTGSNTGSNAGSTIQKTDQAPLVLPMQLVDLPCIIESLKTIDNKQFYKVADVAQMIVVSDPVDPTAANTTTTSSSRSRASADGSWPDGLTPPMADVRRRRFRKRISKKAIEDVEQEIERLLLADADAVDVKYDVHDRRDGDGSTIGGGSVGDALDGSEMADLMDKDGDSASMIEKNSHAGDASRGGAGGSGLAGDADDGDDQDSDLAAEIQEALDAEDDANSQDGDDDKESEDDDEEEDDDNDAQGDDGDNESEDGGPEDVEGDDREDAHLKKQANLLQHEIQDLERKLVEKNAQASSQVNPIMRKRFEEIVGKLTSELDIKRQQLETIQAELVDNEGDDPMDQMIEQMDQMDQDEAP